MDWCDRPATPRLLESGASPAFVLDLMEPERPKVDRAVLNFLKSEALHPADFTIRQDGS